MKYHFSKHLSYNITWNIHLESCFSKLFHKLLLVCRKTCLINAFKSFCYLQAISCKPLKQYFLNNDLKHGVTHNTWIVLVLEISSKSPRPEKFIFIPYLVPWTWKISQRSLKNSKNIKTSSYYITIFPISRNLVTQPEPYLHFKA